MALDLRSLFFAAGFMALGATSTLAMDAAARPGGSEAHRRGPKLPGAGLARAMAQLDLTDAQRASLEELRDDVREDVREARSARAVKRGDIAESILNGELSRAEIHADIDARAAQKVAMAHEMVDRVLDIYETLTPEQRAELSEVIADHAEQADRPGPGDALGGPRGGRR